MYRISRSLLLFSCLSVTPWICHVGSSSSSSSSSSFSKQIVHDYPYVPSISGGIRILPHAHPPRTYIDETHSPHTTYVLGSCSKSMTALAIVKQFHEMNQSVHRPVKEMFNKTYIHPSYANVHLNDLLCMSGGINDGYFLNNISYWKSILQHSTLKEQRAQLTKQVLSTQAAYPPGTSYLYSNMGYVIAAHIAEYLFHTTYEDMMTTYVFTPLGLHHARVPLMNVTTNNNNNTAIGHAIVVHDDEETNYWYHWYHMMNNTLHFPRARTYPTPAVPDGKTYVVPTDLQYPLPVMSAAALVRINMGDWLHYLHTVMVQNTSYLPTNTWNMLLHTGVHMDRGSMYSYGWTYHIHTPDILTYCGFIFTFSAHVTIHQHQHYAIASMTNYGDAQMCPSTPMIQLERDLTTLI